MISKHDRSTVHVYVVAFKKMRNLRLGKFLGTFLLYPFSHSSFFHWCCYSVIEIVSGS